MFMPAHNTGDTLFKEKCLPLSYSPSYFQEFKAQKHGNILHPHKSVQFAGMVAQVYNHSTWEANAGGHPPSSGPRRNINQPRL